MSRTYRKQKGQKIAERHCDYPRPRFPDGVNTEWRKFRVHKPMRTLERAYLRHILKGADWNDLVPLPDRWPMPHFW
ncbi:MULTISPECIES: hypothetical protein [Thalassospira]|jgi:hypothetical protein|uniref:Uncharacterized protein n=2 Tax=Thalassospira TaxID=168934 RepID=A0A367W316_9PROT|nr:MULTISPECIES: hypothetical protein [Thalassospira]MDG4717842.1 hypothetical protein [Thalassospira sp. FZY0004]RCK32360.1 hypothetical protein TH19_18870 [Thalassospira profundimaris]